MPFVTMPNAKVHYLKDGSGPPLVLLHGTGGDGFSHWGQVLGRLTPTHTVICPDYAGSCPTSDDGIPLTLDLLIAQVIAVMDAEGLETVDLAGFSLGSVIAAALAARHPQRVRRLVLTAGLVGGSDTRATLLFDLWRDLIHLDPTQMARLILLTNYSAGWLHARTTEQISKRVAAITKFTCWDGMARQAALDATLDIRADLANIQAPTLSLVGRHDQVVTPDQSQALLDGIADARQICLDSGHMMPHEQPAAVAQAILDFIGAA